MKAQHTPGPWHVVNAGPHYNNKAIDDLQIQYGNDGECISDHVYEVADAHLVAAAPELLEALEELLLRVDERCDGKLGGNSKLAMAGDVARAAISRAKGETS